MTIEIKMYLKVVGSFYLIKDSMKNVPLEYFHKYYA